jgi:hypothetical protein
VNEVIESGASAGSNITCRVQKLRYAVATYGSGGLRTLTKKVFWMLNGQNKDGWLHFGHL